MGSTSAFEVHGIDKRLVAVSEVDAAPDRRLGDRLVRPGAVGKIDLLEGNVLLKGWFHVRYASI